MSLFEELAVVEPGKKKPWEKLRQEKQEHYEAFQTYLAMKDRSIQPVADKHGLNAAYCADLAKLYNWHARCNAYDFNQVSQDITPEIISSKEMTLKDAASEHLSLCQAAQQTAAVGFSIMQKYIKEYEYARDAGDELPPRPYLKTEDLVKMAEFGIKYERLILGEATSRAETKSTDYSSLSNEELAQLQQLLAKTESEDE